MNRQQNTKDLIILFSIFAVAIIWLALIVAGCYSKGMKLFDLLERLADALNRPQNITINQYSLKFVFGFLIAYMMGIVMYFSQRENRRPGEEHGSAKWGNVLNVARKYADRKHRFKNLILSQNLQLGLDAKKHRRNLNVLVVGVRVRVKPVFMRNPIFFNVILHL